MNHSMAKGGSFRVMQLFSLRRIDSCQQHYCNCCLTLECTVVCVWSSARSEFLWLGLQRLSHVLTALMRLCLHSREITCQSAKQRDVSLKFSLLMNLVKLICG